MLKWLGQEDAPLLFRLRADARQWRWALQFLRECTPARTRRNIEQIVRLGTYSRDTLQQLRRDTGLSYDQRTQAILHFYTSEKELESAEAPGVRFLMSHTVTAIRETGGEVDHVEATDSEGRF